MKLEEKLIENEDNKEVTQCPECECEEIIWSNHEIICTHCGIVIEEQNIVSQTRRAFTKEEINKRVQNSPINQKSIDRGYLLTQKPLKNKMLQGKLQTREETKVNNAYKIAISYLKKISTEDKLNLPKSVVKQIESDIIEIAEDNNYHVKNYRALVLADIFVRTQEKPCQKTIEDLIIYSRAYTINKKSIYDNVEPLRKYFKISHSGTYTRAKNHVNRYVNEMEIPTKYIKQANDIIDELAKIKHHMSPITMAMTAIYFVIKDTEDNIPQQKFVEGIITETTLRTNYKKIEELLKG